MEQETKYTIKDPLTADIIWNDAVSGVYGHASGAETVEMEAAYFDTKDRILRDNNIALRVRREGDISFATLKWGGSKTVHGLYEHQEVNVPVDTGENIVPPPPGLFEESIDGRKMSDLIGRKKLRELFRTIVTRRRTKIRYGSSVVELAIDRGRIVAGEKIELISEIEIELYSGDLSDVLALTSEISGQYGLEPENRSKYARALALIES